DDRRHLAKDGLERGRWIRLDRAVHAWQPEAADPDLRSLYAEWDELYRMLALDPARLAALHARVRDLKPPPAPGKGEPDRRIVLAERAIAESLAAVYGPLDALDARLKAEVAAAKPQWFEPLRSVQRAGDEIVAAGRPGLAAIAIRAEPAPKEPFVISCEMQIAGLGEKEAQIYLAFENRSDP